MKKIEYGRYQFEDVDVTDTKATLSLCAFGGTIAVEGAGAGTQNFSILRIYPREGEELLGITEEIAQRVPPINSVVAAREKLRCNVLGTYDEDIGFQGPSSPLVHSINQRVDGRWDLRGGDLRDTLKEVGTLCRTKDPERLVLVMNEAASLTFRPEPLRMLGVIAAQREKDL